MSKLLLHIAGSEGWCGANKGASFRGVLSATVVYVGLIRDMECSLFMNFIVLTMWELGDVMFIVYAVYHSVYLSLGMQVSMVF